MIRELAAVSLLLRVLLSVEPLTPTAAQAGEVTLTLRTDQVTYQVGSWATFTLTFDATTAMTVTMGGRDTLGCSWNLVILDATGTEVFNADRKKRERNPERIIVACLDVAMFRNVPPPIVLGATIPLHNNLQGGTPLPPGHYTVRGLFWWHREGDIERCRPATQGCEPRSAEAIIEITQ